MKNSTAIFIFFITIIFGMKNDVSAQNVGINSTGAAANAAALLDIDAAPGNAKGLLIPRVALSSTSSNAPIGAGVVTSLLIYNTATAGASPNNVVPGYYYWDGTIWISLSGGSGGKDWSLTGNSGTSSATNFIGTTDTQDFVVKTDNSERIRVMSDGKVGIGNSSPIGELDLSSNTRTDFYISSTGTTDEDYADIYMMTNGSAAAGAWRNSATKLLYGGAFSLNFGTIDADDVTLVTSNESRFLIDGTTGYVGIGPIVPLNPSEELEVSGDVLISNNLGIGVNPTAKLHIKDGHLKTEQTTSPTISAVTTYVLGSQSISNATDIAGKLSLTTTAAAGSVTISFNTVYVVAPVVMLTPTNAAAATDITKVFVTSTTGTFRVNFSASPAAGAHTYNYQIIETQ